MHALHTYLGTVFHKCNFHHFTSNVYWRSSARENQSATPTRKELSMNFKFSKAQSSHFTKMNRFVRLVSKEICYFDVRSDDLFHISSSANSTF